MAGGRHQTDGSCCRPLFVREGAQLREVDEVAQSHRAKVRLKTVFSSGAPGLCEQREGFQQGTEGALAGPGGWTGRVKA